MEEAQGPAKRLKVDMEAAAKEAAKKRGFALVDSCVFVAEERAQLKVGLQPNIHNQYNRVHCPILLQRMHCRQHFLSDGPQHHRLGRLFVEARSWWATNKKPVSDGWNLAS